MDYEVLACIRDVLIGLAANWSETSCRVDGYFWGMSDPLARRKGDWHEDALAQRLHLMRGRVVGRRSETFLIVPS